MIHSRDSVRRAVARALLLDPSAGQDTAIRAAAQALGLDIETVRDAVESDPPCQCFPGTCTGAVVAGRTAAGERCQAWLPAAAGAPTEATPA